MAKKKQIKLITSADLIGTTRERISISPAFDMATGGISWGDIIIYGGAQKAGKAQPLDSIIYTIDGPKRMGDIQIGDIICHPSGGWTKVQMIHPQGYKKIYKVTLNDGSQTECCEDHLWKVRRSYNNKNGYNQEWQVLSLRTIIDKGIYTSGKYQFNIPCTKPILFKKRGVKIPPYIMGILLGDGSFRGGISLTNTDQEIVKNFIDFVECRKLFIRKRGVTYFCTSTKNQKIVNSVQEDIREYGLYNLKSKDKFIPKDYLYNSVENRWQLLRGIMDTDGTVSKRGNHIEYASVSEKLAEDVAFLARSLGGKAKISKRFTKCNGKSFPSYRVRLSFNDNSMCFSLNRKKERCIKRTKNELTKTITNIEYVGEKECQCITVENNDGLYITDDCIVTHNTLLAIQTIAKILKSNPDSKCLYWDVEHRLKQNQQLNHPLLDHERFFIMRSSCDHIITGEEGLTEIENFCKENTNCVICIDSTSAIATSGEMAEEVKGNYRSTTPKLLAMFFRRAMSFIPARNHVLINLVHLIDNLSGYGGPKLDSGNSIQFASNLSLITRKKELWKDQDDKVIGQKTYWNVIWSGNSAPGDEFVTYNRYNEGVDEAMEQCELGSEMGLIEQGGAWYTLSFIDKYMDDKEVQKIIKQIDKPIDKAFKFQGIDKVYEFLKEYPYIGALLEKELKEILQ